MSESSKMSDPPQAHEVQSRLAALVVDFRIKVLADVARERGASLALVGGCLRDLVLGRPVHELDLATDQDPMELGRIMARSLGAAFVPLDPEFGTARLVSRVPVLQYDLTRLQGATLAQDLARRDFTVNALGLPVEAALAGDLGRVEDSTGGMDDLRGRRLRACSPRSLPEDPLRIIRGFRFAAHLDLTASDDLWAQMRLEANGLDRVAPERITHELLQLLGAESAGPHLERMEALGVLSRVLPGLPTAPGGYPRLRSVERAWGRKDPGAARTSADPDLRPEPRRLQLVKLAALLGDLALSPVDMETLRGQLHRLTLATRDLGTVWRLTSGLAAAPWRHWLSPPSDLDLFRLMSRMAPDGPPLLWLAGFDPEITAPARASLCVARGAVASRPERVLDPPRLVDGRDLMNRARRPPGPWVGRLLDLIREAQASSLVSSRDEALAFVDRALVEGETP